MSTQNKTPDKEQPFFARYLEGQMFPDVKTGIKAGHTSQKSSDNDEVPTTLKFPSDSEDAGR